MYSASGYVLAISFSILSLPVIAISNSVAPSLIFLTISSPPISAILAPFFIISISSLDFIILNFISFFEISVKAEAEKID